MSTPPSATTAAANTSTDDAFTASLCFSMRQPVHARVIALLERFDRGRLLECQRDIAQAGQQAAACKSIDFEPILRAIRTRHKLTFEMDCHHGAGAGVQLPAQLRRAGLIQAHRQNAMLKAIVIKHVAEAGRNQRAYTVIVMYVDGTES